MSSCKDINDKVNSDTVKKSSSSLDGKSCQNSSEVIPVDERAESSTSGDNSQSSGSRVKLNSDCHETKV